jgi:hypothetical protein
MRIPFSQRRGDLETNIFAYELRDTSRAYDSCFSINCSVDYARIQNGSFLWYACMPSESVPPAQQSFCAGFSVPFR